MDAHGSIGPFKPDYEEDLRRIDRELGFANPVLVRLTDRMTLLELVLVRYEDIVPAGAGPDGLTATHEWLYVARSGDGAGWFRRDAHMDPAYVQQVMGMQYLGDAEILADFLTALEKARPKLVGV